MHHYQKIDYLSRDFAGFRSSLLQYAQTSFPEWTPGSQGDFGVVMVDLFSYVGDVVSYYTDRAQFENYLPTATQRESILNLAFMLGYIPYSGSPAKGTVNLVNVLGTATPTVVPAGLQVITDRVEALDGPVTFETDVDVTLPANPDGTAVPTAVAVTEGLTESFLFLGSSNGMPGQSFSLPHTGVYRDTIRVFVEDITGSIQTNEVPPVAVREWLHVDRMLGQNANDQVFESRIATSATNIYFGDDLTGAIPPRDLRIYATYRHGVGSWGNLAPGTLQTVNLAGRTGQDAVRVAQDETEVYLTSAMTGGADEESDQSIRDNAPRAFRAQERIVTKEDYRAAALAVPGVHSAAVVIGNFTSVTLFITGPNGGVASTDLKNQVIKSLEPKTMGGVITTVGDPTFQPIDFGTVLKPVRVFMTTGHSAADVKTGCEEALTNLLAHMDAEEPLAASMVYSALLSVNGVEYAEIPVFSRVGAGAQTDTTTITPQPWEIFIPGSITLQVV